MQIVSSSQGMLVFFFRGELLIYSLYGPVLGTQVFIVCRGPGGPNRKRSHAQRPPAPTHSPGRREGIRSHISCPI